MWQWVDDCFGRATSHAEALAETADYVQASTRKSVPASRLGGAGSIRTWWRPWEDSAVSDIRSPAPSKQEVR